MTETGNRVPGPNEPDPDNVRLRPLQGGTDSLSAPPDLPADYNTDEYQGALTGRAPGSKSKMVQNRGVTVTPQYAKHNDAHVGVPEQ